MMELAENGGIAYLEQGEEFMELNKDYSTASKEEMEFLKSQLYHAHGINEKLFTCDYTEEQYRAYYSSVMKFNVYSLKKLIENISRRRQGHKETSSWSSLIWLT